LRPEIPIETITSTVIAGTEPCQFVSLICLLSIQIGHLPAIPLFSIIVSHCPSKTSSCSAVSRVSALVSLSQYVVQRTITKDVFGPAGSVRPLWTKQQGETLRRDTHLGLAEHPIRRSDEKREEIHSVPVGL
jgi:hypothetical protein